MHELSLPPPHQTGAPPQPVARSPMPAATILLVEDSRTAADAIRLMAQRAGLRLRRVETMAAARAHLRLYRADAVLIDLGLPDGSGLELIAELARARHRPRHLAAISGDGEARAAALDAGADCFVHKPFTLQGGVGHIFGADLPALSDSRATAPGDPMALSDDLRRAALMLTGGITQAACRFVIGVARCVGDEGLHHAAQTALSAEPQALERLRAMLERRQSLRPLV